MSACAHPSCERPTKAHGLCATHWRQQYRAAHPGFDTWVDMRARCANPAHAAYPRYGGRGISVDPLWETYAGFVADMGARPPHCVLHRKDNDGPYTKSNCVWMTRAEHNRYHAARRDPEHYVRAAAGRAAARKQVAA